MKKIEYPEDEESNIDNLLDRIPKENKYMVTTTDLINYCYSLEHEIERLNNIINELQKWLSNVCMDPQCSFEYRIILDKLKELKEV